MYLNKKLFNQLANTFGASDNCNDVRNEFREFVSMRRASDPAWMWEFTNIVSYGIDFGELILTALMNDIQRICTGKNVPHSDKRSRIQTRLNVQKRRIRCLNKIMSEMGHPGGMLGMGFGSFIFDQIQKILDKFKGLTGEQLCNKITPLFFPETNPMSPFYGDEPTSITIAPNIPATCPESVVDGIINSLPQMWQDDIEQIRAILAILLAAIAGAALALAGAIEAGVPAWLANVTYNAAVQAARFIAITALALLGFTDEAAADVADGVVDGVEACEEPTDISVEEPEDEEKEVLEEEK